ncbi:hypothetical protein ABZ352_18740 [Streptomyces griseofuscus]|uniref:hypothetical protein n=1 Tax=Streptomyces griseofuscus TaxID=146922 RepID=UPI0033DCFD4A
MTTPDFVAGLPTAARRQAVRAAERDRLTTAVTAARAERTAAAESRQKLTQALERARTEARKRHTHNPLFPPSAQREQHLDDLRERIDALQREQTHANALHDAAEVAEASAALELAWLDRPCPEDGQPQPEAPALAALLWRPAEADAAVSAPGYTVTVFSHGPGDPWRAGEPVRVQRHGARSIMSAWVRTPGAYVLRDAYGRLYVATSTARLELVPTDLAPPHTEGDVLRAALAAYGFPAYADGEGGISWLAVPLNPHSSEADTYEDPHFRIASREDADRPASAHDEPWSAGLHGADGDFLTLLDAVPPGTSLAEDCAHIARAVAEYASRRPRD